MLIFISIVFTRFGDFICYCYCLRASGCVHVCVHVCVISDFNILQHAWNQDAPRFLQNEWIS